MSESRSNLVSEGSRGRAGTDSAPLVVVLSSVSGIGKTTVCRKAATLAAERRFTVAGILSAPRSGPAGARGLDVEDVRRGDRRPLADITGPADGPVIGAWRFHRGGLTWGDAILAGAAPCDLLVVDEIGPLELVHETGWANAIPALLAGGFQVALAVVRPALVDVFLRRVAGQRTMTITVTPSNRDRLPGDLVAHLAGGS